MVKTAIVFDHRGRAHGKEEGPLEIRFTVNRKAYYISTGVRVPADDWFSGKVADIPGWDIMDKRIRLIQERLERAINQCLENGEAIDPKLLRERVLGPDDGDASEPFADWALKMIQTYNVNETTRAFYNIFIDRLHEFGKIVSCSDITPEKIMEFDTWLRQRPARIKSFEAAKGKVVPRIKDSTVNNYHRMFKTLIRSAVRFRKLTSNPYEVLGSMIKRPRKSDVDFLPLDDLAKIEACHPTEGSVMEIVRDLFLLQTYTGMAYGDIIAFDISKYHNDNGVWRAVLPRRKTGEPFVSQLLPQAVAILEKYRMKVPYMDKTWYNKMLKPLGEVLGIKTKLTTHVARHTFGTMMLQKNVRIEHVSKMMGHTNITTTQIYAKVLAGDVYASYDEVAKKSEE